MHTEKLSLEKRVKAYVKTVRDFEAPFISDFFVKKFAYLVEKLLIEQKYLIVNGLSIAKAPKMSVLRRKIKNYIRVITRHTLKDDFAYAYVKNFADLVEDLLAKGAGEIFFVLPSAEVKMSAQKAETLDELIRAVTMYREQATGSTIVGGAVQAKSWMFKALAAYEAVNTENEEKVVEEPLSILQEAEKLVHGDRAKAYGHPYDNCVRVATMWGAILGHRVAPEQIGLCMIALKLGRECQKPGRDNMVDIAGYAETVEMVKLSQQCTASRKKPGNG